VVDIVSHRRSRPICAARHAAYRMARDLTFLSLPQIGQRIGGRDHTTVLHGVRKTRSLFPDLVLDPEESAESCARILATRYGALA
jgi:chromosomal replication initiator protein